MLHLANWRNAGYGDATEARGTIEARRASFTNTMEGPVTVRSPSTPGSHRFSALDLGETDCKSVQSCDCQWMNAATIPHRTLELTARE